MILKNQTIDKKEISHFNSLASQWWDEKGEFAALHELNPVRLKYICHHVRSNGDDLKGKSILDVGCGGGLLSEPMSRLGGNVLGIDASENNIQIAQHHAQQQHLSICYEQKALESISEKYDIITAMEIVEHVADVECFLKLCCQRLKPGGFLFLSTLNKTVISYLLGIVAAEYILRWVPKGTHDWNKFQRPEEITQSLQKEGCQVKNITGVRYSMIQREWIESSRIDVNYMMVATLDF